MPRHNEPRLCVMRHHTFALTTDPDSVSHFIAGDTAECHASAQETPCFGRYRVDSFDVLVTPLGPVLQVTVLLVVRGVGGDSEDASEAPEPTMGEQRQRKHPRRPTHPEHN